MNQIEADSERPAEEPSVHLFVDCENVGDIPDRLLSRKPEVILVTGVCQKSQPLVLARKLAIYKIIPKYFACVHAGKNALDFVLVELVTRKSIENPDSHIHIISNDQGYDALIAHLREEYGTHIERHCAPVSPVIVKTATQPVPESSSSKLDPYVDRILLHFKKVVSKNLPKKDGKLQAWIKSHLGNQLNNSEVQAIIRKLVKDKILTITPTGAVQYHLKGASKLSVA